MNKLSVILVIVIVIALAAGVGVIALRSKLEKERGDKEMVQGELASLKKEKEDLDKQVKEKTDVIQALESESEILKKQNRTMEEERLVAFYRAQVIRQIDGAAGFLAGQGYEKTNDHIDALPNGGDRSFTLNLNSGWQYSLISVCDRDCSDIDIYIYDLVGNLITKDDGRDKVPNIVIDVNRTGVFRVRVVMYRCNSSPSPCVYGIGVFGKVNV
jgi:hypothetical protein